MNPRKGKQTQDWIEFCKDNYNATPDDISDAYELANNPNMREKLTEKRIKFLESINLPKHKSR